MWVERWDGELGSAVFYRVRPRLTLMVTVGEIGPAALPALIVKLDKVVRDAETQLYWDASEMLGGQSRNT